MMRGVGAQRDWDPLETVKVKVRSQPGRQRVAYNAAGGSVGSECQLARLGIAIGQWRSGRKRTAAQREMARQRQIRGECIVELPEWVRRKTDGRQKVLKILHLIRRQTR